MSRIQWRPRLFSALGAGFLNDSTIMDGVHLRWSLDPRMGFPRAPHDKGYEIAFSRTKEGSITRVDLFTPSAPYPVRSNKTVLPAGPGTVHRNGNELSFLRPLVAQNWNPHWTYLNRRAQLDILMPNPQPEAQDFLEYMDDVMHLLGPESPTQSSEREDVVAVDLRFRAPCGPGPIRPTLPDVPILEVDANVPFFGGLRRDLRGANVIDQPHFIDHRRSIHHFRSQVIQTVQGLDHCGRLVAEDWVGRYPHINIGGHGGILPVQAGNLKLTARLRAAGIRTVRIVPRRGLSPLAEDEIRWVFCDEYASGQGLWVKIDQQVLQSDPGTYMAGWLRDDIYSPFHAGIQALDWQGMSARLRSEFLETPEIQDLLHAGDTFETWRTTVNITDSEAPTGTSDDSVSLPLLAAIQTAAVDPVVARLLGLYGHVPSNADFQSRDWRILIRPPFANSGNLVKLDNRLRALMDPGQAFFHSPGDSLTSSGLAGLVLDAQEAVRPPPPKPAPELDTNIQLLPSNPEGWDNLVSATITAADEKVETRPFSVNASYEVFRGLTDEISANVLDDTQAGPLDEFGILPNVLIPEFNSESCLSTGRLNDLFARDAAVSRQLGYMVRGFDIFGRPSAVGSTPLVDIPAACLPPTPPGAVSTFATRAGDALSMTLDFDLRETAQSIEADWQALEILIHPAPVTEGSAPEDSQWPGAQPGRLLEFDFDPTTLILQTTSIQHSCLELAWSADELTRLPQSETACAAFFPGLASVSPNATTVAQDGHTAYRLTLGLGMRNQYPHGLNAWCARLRVRGLCPVSEHVVHSPEVTVRATLMLPEPPPEVVQPPIEALPLSTYPDVLGTGYYPVNLRDVLSPVDQTDATLIKVYLARLEALTDHPEDFVDQENVLDPPGLLALARQSRARFALVSDPPEAFNPSAPHVNIAVPAELSEVYVAAILGANGQLETGKWQQAAFLPFRTPPLRALPLVDWTRAGIDNNAGVLQGNFSVVARFPAPLPEPSQAPMVQLFRRDVSSGERQARFIASALGLSQEPNAATPDYEFNLTDDGVDDWRRYEYAIQLLDYAPGRGQHVKIGERMTRMIGASSSGQRDPFSSPTAVAISANPGGGFVIDVDMASGDFTVYLEKVPNAGDSVLHQCRIEAGNLYTPPELEGSLTLGPSCQLRLIDPSGAAGLYKVRLQFGQLLSTSQEERTP